MGCNCGKNKSRDRYDVKLPGGLTVTKSSKDEADKFAARHKGSTVRKRQ